jgi:glycosyltransferase involved in cell wall biosynthesis
MRIAQIAPVATTIPPPKSGSVELMTSLLTEGLVERGHEVTLFATADSVSRARIHAQFPHGYWHDDEMYPWEFYEMVNLSAACERAAEFDIIHYQAAYYPMSLAFVRLIKTPFLQTVHLQPDESQKRLWRHYPEARFVAISHAQAAAMRDLNVVGTIYHGIETDKFTFRAEPEEYLVFFGRFTPEKGVLEAIEVARRLRMKLLMAAPEDLYYHEAIRRHVDGKTVEYVGEVDHEGRNKLLGGALAMLYPVQAGEPFGLVLAESMACGTPVLALDKGAVTEIVINGLNGFRVNTLDEMVEIFPEILKLSRAAVRADAVARFDTRRMVDDYLKIYEQIVNGEK